MTKKPPFPCIFFFFFSFLHTNTARFTEKGERMSVTEIQALKDLPSEHYQDVKVFLSVMQRHFKNPDMPYKQYTIDNIPEKSCYNISLEYNRCSTFTLSSLRQVQQLYSGRIQEVHVMYSEDEKHCYLLVEWSHDPLDPVTSTKRKRVK